ncbi:MAG: hypothetical protein QOD99_2392 [Chthoniobacter sp.]|jgi:hypothetical protein|nr:hypothetical protein [Chthoniobacter sp.]
MMGIESFVDAIHHRAKDCDDAITDSITNREERFAEHTVAGVSQDWIGKGQQPEFVAKDHGFADEDATFCASSWHAFVHEEDTRHAAPFTSCVMMPQQSSALMVSSRFQT